MSGANEVVLLGSDGESPSPRLQLPHWGQIFLKFSKIAFPLMVSFTISMEVFAVGPILGRLTRDEEDRAAIVLISTFMNTVVLGGISPLIPEFVLLSNLFGRYREAESSAEKAQIAEQIFEVFRTAMKVAAGLLLPMFLILFFSKDLSVHLFAQNPNVAEKAQRFLRPYAFAAPGLLLRVAFDSALFPSGKTYFPMLVGFSTFSIGTALACWFAYGGWGVSSMGYQGVALGYLVEAYLIALGYGAGMWGYRDLSPFAFFKLCRAQITASRGTVKQFLAWIPPLSITIVNEFLMTFAAGIFAGTLSVEAQGAMSYAMQFIYLMIVPSLGFGLSTYKRCLGKLGRETMPWQKDWREAV